MMDKNKGKYKNLYLQ